MTILPILALFFAGLELLAVCKGWRRLELIAKPAVMACLFAWLWTRTGLAGNLSGFGAGLLFSLLGDVLLLVPGERVFMAGLAAFLLAHVSYLYGLQDQLFNLTVWSFILLFFIFMNGVRLLRRIAAALRSRGQGRLVLPVSLYGLLLSLVLYAAMSTIFDPAWKTSAAFYLSAGAFLFWASDLLLAWNKFVVPIRHGRIFNILTYQLGQIGLIAGVISQFG